jgi:hypothetical protein
LSFKQLFDFAQNLEPKISRNEIRKEVIRLTGKNQVTHIRTGLNTDVCRGFFLSSKNTDARLVQQVGGTVIATARGLTEEHNSGLVRKCGLHKLMSLAHIHTLQLLHHVEDLQG